MVTEDDFQRAIDQNEDDWQTRLVFADWLAERGDEREMGYRALAKLGVRVCRYKDLVGYEALAMGHGFAWEEMAQKYPDRCWWCNIQVPPYKVHCLPNNWFKAVEELHGPDIDGFVFRSRREAEDCAARAFLKLDPDTREEILS